MTQSQWSLPGSAWHGLGRTTRGWIAAARFAHRKPNFFHTSAAMAHLCRTSAAGSAITCGRRTKRTATSFTMSRRWRDRLLRMESF